MLKKQIYYLLYSKKQKITILILVYLMANSQLKCSIIYKKIAMGAGDDERIINHEWP